jgi:transcription-repair coupling factor (superfamily II helicase)
MRQVVEGEVQVLVCTTIIEAGLDISNVNTLIIEDADKLGLAQLHQIRGRVGRSNRRAFAYLTYRRGKSLAEAAAKRLAAIREFAEFGSGLKIAMRDLEIRGAGNLLGSEQSGHMLSVGYEMYLRLLEEAVLEEQGIITGPRVDCVADLPVRASLPEKYIAHAGIRMDFYRRIAGVTTEEEASDMIDELVDRFGDVPGETHTLLRVALVRAAASRGGFTELAQKGGRLLARLPQPDFTRVANICGLPEYKGRVLFSAGNDPHLSLKLVSGEGVLEAAEKLVVAYGG